MAKYIDADELNRQIKNGEDYYCGYTDDYRKGIKRGIEMTEDCVRRMPAADVEPVRHGEWKYIYTDGFWRCSECGYSHLGNHINSKFCPNCGVKLDGGSERNVQNTLKRR